jgi:hypothetical protein
VDDAIDRPTPPKRVRRPRRFVLPEDHHDARTSERIEAFIEGPARPSRKRARSGQRRPHRPIVLDTPAEWEAAIRHEEIRVERYGRAATVLVVEVCADCGPPAGKNPSVTAADLVEPVIEAIRHEARETDHVVRVSPTRFHLLLPETGEAEAETFVARLNAASRDRLNGHGSDLRLRVESATPGHGRSLADALEDGERRLAG